MAFKMKGFNPGHGTGGGSAFLKKSSPYKAETNYLDDKTNPPANNSGGGDDEKKNLGAPKGRIGSEYRRKEYDARGWKYDDTIAGYNRDGSKKTDNSGGGGDSEKPKPTKTQKIVNKGEVKKTKIAAKAAKKTGEVTENVDRKTARQAKREARKQYGRGSKEFLEAKGKHLAAKEADRQGAEGGRKQNILRKASSKINKKRQEKNKAKLDAKNAE